MRIAGISSNLSSSATINGGGVLRRTNEKDSKLAAEKRENEILANENKRIEEIKGRITQVSESELETDVKEAKIERLSNQIKQIYENRAERERLKAEREMEEQRAEQEEKLREQEEAAKKNKEAYQDPEDAIVREDVSGMVKLAVSADGIQKLKQTQSLRKAEASRLQKDIENDTGIQQIGLETTLKVKLSPHDLPNSFRSRNLAKLNAGIAKLDATIHNEIGKMNEIREEWTEDREEIVTNDTEERDDRNKGEVKADETKTEESAEKKSEEQTNERQVDTEAADKISKAVKDAEGVNASSV